MVEHEAEIFARPARVWFQSEKEKLVAKSESLIASSLLMTCIHRRADLTQRPVNPPMSTASPVRSHLSRRRRSSGASMMAYLAKRNGGRWLWKGTRMKDLLQLRSEQRRKVLGHVRSLNR